jgi:hypothetical protein
VYQLVKDMSGDITFIVITLVIITSIIFALAVIALLEVKKAEKALLALGKRDSEILEDHKKDKKPNSKRKTFVVSTLHFVSYAFVVAIIAAVIAASIIHKNGDMIFANGKSSLVIASNSMSSIADPEKDVYNQKVENGGNLTDEMIAQQFVRGDVLSLNTLPSEDEMIKKDEHGNTYTVDNGKFKDTLASDYLNTIFAFKYQDMIVVHRLVSINKGTVQGEEAYLYTFQGDLYPTQTQLVTYDSLRAVYDGHSKAQSIGYVILFAGSIYGTYVLVTCVGMVSLSTYFSWRIQKMYDARYEAIMEQKKEEEEQPSNDEEQQ